MGSLVPRLEAVEDVLDGWRKAVQPALVVGPEALLAGSCADVAEHVVGDAAYVAGYRLQGGVVHFNPSGSGVAISGPYHNVTGASRPSFVALARSFGLNTPCLPPSPGR